MMESRRICWQGRWGGWSQFTAPIPSPPPPPQKKKTTTTLWHFRAFCHFHYVCTWGKSWIWISCLMDPGREMVYTCPLPLHHHPPPPPNPSLEVYGKCVVSFMLTQASLFMNCGESMYGGWGGWRTNIYSSPTTSPHPSLAFCCS